MIVAAASAAVVAERRLHVGDWVGLSAALAEAAAIAGCPLAAGYYSDLYDFRIAGPEPRNFIRLRGRRWASIWTAKTPARSG